MRKISILPSVITLGNIISGFASVVLAADGDYELAAWMILLGMVFDALDGQVARLTKTAGGFGVQLDSLCDMVTFGLAPAILINRISLEYGGLGMPVKFVWLLSVLYAPAQACPRHGVHGLHAGGRGEGRQGAVFHSSRPGRPRLERLHPLKRTT